MSDLQIAPELILGQEAHEQLNAGDVLQKRDSDSYKIFNRKRNAHACIMSIVFIVLFPLGAISIHLPIDRIPYLNKTYLRNKVPAIHAPIQLLGLVMMIGGMALGIRIGYDLGYLKNPVQTHPVIGLIVVCTIIVFQPILGILQHRHFKKTGGKSIFAYMHRWIGRCAIVLGIINNGLGFQLAATNVIIHTSSYIRNYVILAGFVSVWLGLLVYDDLRIRREKAATKRGEKGGMDEMELTANRAAKRGDPEVLASSGADPVPR